MSDRTRLGAKVGARVGAMKVVVAAAVGILALAGCAAAHPGSAAVVGDTKITEETVSEQMVALNTALDRPADAPSEVAAAGIVSQEITRELIEQTAEKLGASVPPAQVDEAYQAELERAGSEEELAAAAAQAFVPKDRIKRFLATRLLFSAMAQRLAPGATPEELTQLAVAAVTKTGEEVGVEVAPRYGAWSPSQLQIVPEPDPVSKPAEGAANPFDQLQVPQQ